MYGTIRRSGQLPATLIAFISLALLGSSVLYLAGGPIFTDDLWWHIKAGEAYATQGPWPGSDPMLHTAHQEAPVQHEWLFGVAVYLVDRTLGFHGLRLVHALLVTGILWLAYSLFRRRSQWPVAAATATSVFVVLSWLRLVQFRPDLVSIPATLLVYRLLIEGERVPSWNRVLAAVALILVWANMHSLFAVGLALLVAALVGCLLRTSLLRYAAPRGQSIAAELDGSGRWARRVGAALGLGWIAALVNPRGIGQHLTFLTSSESGNIWEVRDEWTPFDPFDWGGTGFAGNALTWTVADLLLAAFLATAAYGAARFLLRPSASTLRRIDPVGMGLGLASVVAISVSVRFLWMGVFPLLFLLRVQREALEERPVAKRRLGWGLAAASLGLALSLPLAGGFGRAASLLPRSVADYVARPYVTDKYHSEGVRFLRESGLDGNLYNNYWMGGFLGYWLAPRMRTYIDGRAEHYPYDVLEEVPAVGIQKGVREGEGYLDVLDRRRVDVFFGVGLPPTGSGRFEGVHNATALERAEGWILVSRSIDHAIYLRADQRNRENLKRVESYYAREDVPFDPARGFDPAEVIRVRPDWAAAHRLLPLDYQELFEGRDGSDAERRFRARDELGLIYAVTGAYRAALENDREASLLRPAAEAPLRRQVYALLRLDRPSEAGALASILERLSPTPRHRRISQLARHYQRTQDTPLSPRDALLNWFPLLNATEEIELVEGFVSPLVE